MTDRETSSEIDAAAAVWAVRADRALDDGERAELDAWLEGDIRRVGAFARAQAVLVHARRAKALGAGFQPATYSGEAPVAAAPLGVTRTGLNRRRLLAGGSAAAAAGIGAILLPTARASARLYETARGEIRLVPLGDGATVTLNTESRVTIDHEGRAVEVERGEALFKVASASEAPITVEAAGASVRTSAAVFAICRVGRAPLEVKVCEGDVALSRGGLLSRATRHLRANVQATLSSDGRLVEQPVAPGTLQRELAWQEGMLSFEDTSLEQAAREFARYSDRAIRIPDPAIARETVTGRFAASDPEGFAQAVALSLDLRVRADPEKIVLIR